MKWYIVYIHTAMAMSILRDQHGSDSGDALAVRLVALHDEVVGAKRVDRERQLVRGSLAPGELRERPRIALELLLERLDVIAVDVRVAELVDELVRVRVGHARDHVRQQRVRGDVEGHAEPEVGRALVHEAAELGSRALGLRQRDVELAEHVAGRQRHLPEVCSVRASRASGRTGWIPRREDDPSVRRRLANLPHHLRQLIDALAGVVGVAVDVRRAKVPPLKSVDGTEIALAPMGQSDAVEEGARAVAVPDLDAEIGQQLAVGRTAHEPQQLLEHAAHEHPLGREQRQRHVRQREAHRRRSEERLRARARPIRLGRQPRRCGSNALGPGRER